MKTCTKCKQQKSFSAFDAEQRNSDGLCRWCKDCKRKWVREWKRKQWATNSAYRTSALAYSKRPDVKAKKLAYARTPAGKAVHTKALAKYYNQNRTKILARDAVRRAVRGGKIQAANLCTCDCGNIAAEYHHYMGYEKEHRLDVIAVCVRCHARIDKEGKRLSH